ncbi:hypothetical protein [Chitinophaga qingshengii]|uniref:Redoxin domain-containing protein n=1 Tax=Chitinophaga qingshengii TaxID=1569794 RepID=A0ABR7TMP8_9BACT|nr:hypothetical protein [Chitinophaga qingshengii]MBC9931761.1 hypothetical protein [Chitinophaga qingshengii]
MGNRNIYKFKVLLAFCLLWLLACRNGNRWSDRNLIDSVPSMNILLLDSASVLNTRSEIMSGNVVYVFFDPYCQFCQKEVGGILDGIAKFHDTKFCFLTISSLQDAREFYKTNEISRFPNVYVGIDTSGTYLKYFNVKTVPHTSIYRNYVVREIFSRPVVVDSILVAVKNLPR